MSVDADLVEAVRERLARDSGGITPHRVAGALRESGRPVGDATVLAVHEALRRDVVGAGPLESLLRLPDVTDVLVNGTESVYVDRGHGLERVDVTFPGEEAVRRLAQRLAASGGRRLDDATPHVDVRLRDGTRFHAVLAPLARPGTVLSLRVPHHRVLSIDDLVAAGTLTEHGARLLRLVVERRLAFLISGGTRPLAEPVIHGVPFESQSIERVFDHREPKEPNHEQDDQDRLPHLPGRAWHQDHDQDHAGRTPAALREGCHPAREQPFDGRRGCGR